MFREICCTFICFQVLDIYHLKNILSLFVIKICGDRNGTVRKVIIQLNMF